MTVVDERDLRLIHKYLYHKPQCRNGIDCKCGLDDITDRLGIARVKYCREQEEK